MKHLSADRKLDLVSRGLGFVMLAAFVLAIVRDAWGVNEWGGVFYLAATGEVIVALVRTRRSRARLAAKQKKLDDEWAALLGEMRERSAVSGVHRTSKKDLPK